MNSPSKLLQWTMVALRTRSILLAGFEPFGSEASNPSWDAVSALHGELVAGHRVEARCLPVEFGSSLRLLRAAIFETRPMLVLGVGQAGGRAQLSLERVAINVDDARIADNRGWQPIDTPVVKDGPDAYFTTLPIKAMRAALCDAGMPAEISQTAGTYVCNHVFYGLMHALRTRRSVRAGFMHIPYSPRQAAAHAGAPSLPVDIVAQALRIALHTAFETTIDRRLAGGAEH